MIVTNKETGQDVSGLVLKLMQKKITQEEFEKLTGLEPADSNPSRKAWEKRNGVKK